MSRGLVWCGEVRHLLSSRIGRAGHDLVRLGGAGLGMAGEVRRGSGLVRLGVMRHGRLGVSRSGVVGLGMDWHGRLGPVRSGSEGLGLVCCLAGVVSFGWACSGRVRQSWLGAFGQGSVGYGPARQARPGSARFGTVRHGTARQDVLVRFDADLLSSRPGLVGHGQVGCGMACHGIVV